MIFSRIIKGKEIKLDFTSEELDNYIDGGIKLFRYHNFSEDALEEYIYKNFSANIMREDKI